MGAYKQFLSTDVTVVPFVVNKNFYFQGFNELTGSGIDFLVGNNIPDYPNPSSSLTAGLINISSSQKSVFNSIKQLYYTNYLNTTDFYLYIWPDEKFLPTDNNDLGIDAYKIGSQFSQSFGSDIFYNLFDYQNIAINKTWLIQTSKESYYSPFHYNSSTISKFTPPEFTTKFTGKLSYNLYIYSSDTPESASLAVLKNDAIIYTSSYFSSSFNVLDITVTASGELDVLIGDKLKFGFLSTPTNNNILVSSSITLQLTQQEGASKTLVTDYNNNIIENDSTTNTYYRYYNYDETTLYTNQGFPTQTTTFRSESKFLPQLEYGRVRVLSIPKELYGDYIKPKTFFLQFDAGANNPRAFDDGNGFLRVSSSTNNPDAIAGYISYKHGLAILPIYSSNNIISRSAVLWTTTGGPSTTQPTCSFQSTRTIYETQYKCTIRPDEFNYSLNPSLISGSTDGTPYNFVTGSYFAPYVTTVGLYNERQELLAVAKLGQPLPTSPTTDTTIIINLDM
jgi:hypothetical protein